MVRQPSERAAAGDRGSVLQALRELNAAPDREQPRRSAPRGPSPAFLPARPGAASRCDPTSTGAIDVRALAAARLQRGAAPQVEPRPAAPCPPQPPAPVAITTPAAWARSTLVLQVRAFVLGALCAGILTGSIALAATSTQAAAPASAGEK